MFKIPTNAQKVKINQPNSSFHGKIGYIIRPSVTRKNSYEIRFPNNSFTFGFPKDKLILQ